VVASLAEFRILSPVDGRVYATGRYARDTEIAQALEQAERAFRSWKRSSLRERGQLVMALADALAARKQSLAEALAWQVGRPLEQADETPRFKLVTEKHIEVSEALKEQPYPSEGGLQRFVRREGQGVHLSIAPWNYPVGLLPWLIVAPILGGNSVILKHADQTAIIGDILKEAYEAIGGPPGVLQVLPMRHADAEALIGLGRIRSVNFIGSVRGGLEVHRAAAGTLTHVHLELGGKDPAYVRTDADLVSAIPNLADGCFSNSGQSCCSVERLYVHGSIYEAFLDRFALELEKWTLGNPITGTPMIGPVVRQSSADYIRRQVAEAIASGAHYLAKEGAMDFERNDNCYVAPAMLTDVHHSLSIMREELFGPLACIQRVGSDQEAQHWMNDSDFALTASVWTRDIEAGSRVANELDAGTVFINRCDHADLYLPWGGRKRSGLGRCNGREGLLQVTDAKSYHVRSAC
jgi:acyl-CoA reductase-like NAD-dependent aldehyde dehydrogenase